MKVTIALMALAVILISANFDGVESSRKVIVIVVYNIRPISY